MKYQKKKCRLELIAERRAQLNKVQSGTGVHIFRNNSKGELTLPKISLDGKKSVQPRETFKGDSYFFQLRPEVGLVETLDDGKTERKNMTEQKLILDQPDRVTPAGKVEQVVVSPKQKLNETTPQPQTQSAEVLINEDPLAGVQIILND